jgi:hypothetical protein
MRVTFECVNFAACIHGIVLSYFSRFWVRFFGGRAALRCDSLQFEGPLARSCVASETMVRVGICTQRGERVGSRWAPLLILSSAVRAGLRVRRTRSEKGAKQEASASQ